MTVLACGKRVHVELTKDAEDCLGRNPVDLQYAQDSCVRAINASGDRDSSALRARFTELHAELIKAYDSERGPATVAAERLYWFLTNGEDGCSCQGDLKELVQAFQKAHNSDPLGRGPRSVDGGAAGPVPTDGYMERSTSHALALYTGRWVAPCYGPKSSRCGPVPGTSSPSEASEAKSAGPSSMARRSGGACERTDVGSPEGVSTCLETRFTDKSASPTRVQRIRAALRRACLNRNVADRIVPDWTYQDDCPTDERIAGCRVADRNDRALVELEWFYSGSGTIEQVRERCRGEGGALVMPSAAPPSAPE